MPFTTTQRLWRLAGGLAIAHVALILIGVSFETSPMLGDKASVMRDALVTSSMTKQFTGGYIEFLGMLVLLAVGTLLARLVRGEGDVPGWLSSLMTASVATTVAVNLASGFAAGAAALYNGHNGADLQTITAVNNIRDFSFYLAVAALGLFTIALGAAAQVTGVLPRWVSYSGYAVGALSIAAVPGATHGAVAIASMAWMVWFVAVGVVALRVPRAARATAPGLATAAA